jgi:inhibitor of KinA
MPPVYQYSIQPLGDRALVIELASAISAEAAARASWLCRHVLAAGLPGVRDAVPAFCSLTVHYDPLQFAAAGSTPAEAVRQSIEAVLSEIPEPDKVPERSIEIPVCYGGEFGEDLEELARQHDMTADRVVELHTAAPYFVGMLGFAPGFPYLGGLDRRLITARRSTPRARVPRGSVAIGGEHCGIYPLDSPGGWHIIGRTPLMLFDLNRDPPSLLQAGNKVRFVAIAAEAFERVEAGGRWP